MGRVERQSGDTAFAGGVSNEVRFDTCLPLGKVSESEFCRLEAVLRGDLMGSLWLRFTVVGTAFTGVVGQSHGSFSRQAPFV